MLERKKRNADLLVFKCRCFSGSECGCFLSLGLFFLHGLIKVSAAQPVLYNPDVLLIMSSCATPKKLPFLIFNVKVHWIWYWARSRVTGYFIFFPVVESQASKYKSGIVHCWNWFWHSLCLVHALYNMGMVLMVSTVVRLQVISCYRNRCWQLRKYSK